MAGAGSGYIEYVNMAMKNSFYQVELGAGNGLEASFMTIMSEGVTILSETAAPGGNSYQSPDDDYKHGGDGYCGGMIKFQSSFNKFR